MNPKQSAARGLTLVLIVLVAAACGPMQAARPHLTNPPVPPSTTPTSLQVPSGTTPTSTQVPPSATPTPSPSPVLEQWDLLIITDSSNWGVGQYYAKLIEADMNVKVNLHDCWIGTLPVTTVLKTLQNGSNGSWGSAVSDQSCNKPLSDLIKEAEVMVLFGNPIDADPPSGFNTCMVGGYYGKKQMSGFKTYKETMLASCSPENWATYKTNLGLLIDEIYKIREGSPLILRMTDFYIPVHSQWTFHGVDEVCTACIGAFSEAIRQAAEEHGVPVADTMAGFNGLDYMSDPVEAGYIGTDGMHISDKGAQYIANLLQQTGYEYAGK